MKTKKQYRIVHFGDDYIAVTKDKDSLRSKNVYEITGITKKILEEILPVDIQY